MLAAGGVWIYQVYKGLGIAGYAHPIFWGAYIVTFVFWVGIAHAGTLISAILYLFRAKWRNAINRSAEAMTIFAVLTAAQFLGIHVGRIWKSYFILPYPNQRALWVNFKSPLLWDTFAITTYATTSMVFFYVGLIPDLAIARDRSTGWRRALYAVLSLGWQGTSRQWKSHSRAVLHLSGLATPLVLSVHSVVSWDFAMSIVPGWHATIFAPYFVAGAIFSGFAMVLTMMIPVRRIFGLEEYITDYHFENMARFLLLTSIIVGYAYMSEYFIAWYSGVETEQTAFWKRAFGPYWISTWIMIICNARLPADPVVQEGAHPRADPVRALDADQHRHVVRALRDHHRRPVARVRPGGVGHLHAVLARADHRGRLLRLLRPVLPDLPEALPGGRDRRGEGARDPRQGATPEADTDAAAARRLRTSRTTSPARRAACATAASPSSRSSRRRPSTRSTTRWIPKPSGVRVFTLIGGLTGVVTGYAMTIWMANDWPIMIGGKPFSSIPPYTIIAFELTILFGGLMTVLGLFVVGELPRFKPPQGLQRALLRRGLRPRRELPERDVAEIDGLLREHHATEVSLVEA